MAAASADAVLDPEFALWLPGRKRYFDIGASAREISPIILPPQVGLPKNTFLTVDMITREALKVLENQLRFAHRVDMDFFRGEQWPVMGRRVGDTIQIRKPQRFASNA